MCGGDEGGAAFRLLTAPLPPVAWWPAVLTLAHLTPQSLARPRAARALTSSRGDDYCQLTGRRYDFGQASRHSRSFSRGV